MTYEPETNSNLHPEQGAENAAASGAAYNTTPASQSSSNSSSSYSYAYRPANTENGGQAQRAVPARALRKTASMPTPISPSRRRGTVQQRLL